MRTRPQPIARVATRVPARRGSAFEVARRRSYFAFILPALVVFAAVMILPTIFSIVVSFMRWSGGSDIKFIGFENYVRTLRDPVFQHSLVNTFLIVVVVGIAVYIASFFLTIVVQQMRGKRVARLIIFFPTLIPSIVISILWGFLFNSNGLINQVLHAVGVKHPPQWLTQANIIWVILLGMVWMSVGLYAVILLAAADRIPPELYEAADLAGVNALQRFWYVTLPLMWEVVSVTAILWCVSALKLFEFLITFASGSTLPDPSLWNIAVYSYAAAFPTFGVANFGSAAATGILMVLFSVGLTVLARRVMRREDLEY